jgi:biotin transport system substrate-specific component
MVTVAVMAAVMCVVSPLALPIGPVPISLATLVIYLFALVLGLKGATVACLIYLLLGAVGVPVFAGFTGGVGILFGATGGYLISYVLLAIICGWAADHWPDKIIPYAIAAICGTIILYAIGTLWLALYLNMSFKAALFAGVIPFLPGDAAKIVIALVLGFPLRKALKRAHLLA